MKECTPMPIGEPRYHAEILGGPEDGSGVYVSQAFVTLEMAVPIENAQGGVLKRRVDVYRLVSKEPHLVYRHERCFEVEGEQGKW
jgi:hypothetical protein